MNQEEKMHRHARSILLAMALVLVALFASLDLSGCQRMPPKITVRNAQVEFSKDMKDEALVTMTIDNEGGADKIVGVETSIPGATVRIHKMSGMMMTIVKEFDIPAKSSNEFRIGASHIMIAGLPDSVGKGYQFTLSLKFEKTATISLPLTFSKPRPHPAKGS